MMFCTKGCKNRYAGGKVFMVLVKDCRGIPKFYTCPECGFSLPLNRTEMVIELIQAADWEFEVPEDVEVEGMYLRSDKSNKLVNMIMDAIKISKKEG